MIDITPKLIEVHTSNNQKKVHNIHTIYENEPNHVAVQIKGSEHGGTQVINISVNKRNSTVEIGSQYGVAHLRYFSFASGAEKQKQEFFYNCKKKTLENVSNWVPN